MGNCKGKAEKSEGKSIESRQKTNKQTNKHNSIPLKFYLGLKKSKCLPDRQNMHKGTLEWNRCSI